jgi:hypothetical protein
MEKGSDLRFPISMGNETGMFLKIFNHRLGNESI